MLEEMLEETQINWSDITKIACTIGPGSFTGLRVGLATARGLALALDCPCIGGSVFEAMASDQQMPLAVLMDAKRNQLWLQTFDAIGVSIGEPVATSIADACAHIPKEIHNLAGSGTAYIAPLDTRFRILNELASPPIEGVARCASSGNSSSNKPKPMYLRAPDAKPQNSAILIK
jgi:tRNA threonylcarbamoyl adenosine modification protein YeaZ